MTNKNISKLLEWALDDFSSNKQYPDHQMRIVDDFTEMRELQSPMWSSRQCIKLLDVNMELLAYYSTLQKASDLTALTNN